MAFSLFTKSAGTDEATGELALVIDIESGLVRGSLVWFTRQFSSSDIAGPGIPPHIFYTTSSEIAVRGGANGVNLLAAMVAAVSRVSEAVLGEGLKITSSHSLHVPVSKIHVVFSSPWIISKTKTVKISYKEEAEITKSTIREILDAERARLEKEFASGGNPGEIDLAFVEQKIFEVKLNGYPTVHYEHKLTRELEVSFVISIGSKSILARIEKAIEKSLLMEKRSVACHSSLLLQYSALRNIVTGAGDYLVIHVHNEISDIIVVKNGICAAMASFPAGTALISQISGALLNQSKELAHSSLNLQSKKALHPAENSRIEVIADAGAGKWSIQFMETLSALGPADSMPHRAYLLANEHYAHFERALQSNKLRNFTVTPIERSILDSAVTHENKEREDALMTLYVFALQ